MKHTRSLTLTATVLALLISACSQPQDLSAPTLEPQFGTADDDIGIDVAVSSTGQIYGLSQHMTTAPYYDAVITVNLRRYSSGGNVLWEREVLTSYAQNDDDHLKAHAVYTDTNGNVYVWFSDAYTINDIDEGTSETRRYNELYKYDPAGNLIDNRPASPHCLDLCSVDIAVDKSGNDYVARSGYGYVTGGIAYESVVTKNYVWERPSAVGVLKGITVSNSGSVYVVGTKGLARYSNSGGLTWTKPGNFEEVIISGSNLYTCYRNEIRKYDSTGKQLWLKSQSGLSTMVFQDMDGDSSGNVYLSGKYDTGGGNMSAFARKLNSSGSVLWTKTYGTSSYDDARGIATLSGSEVYVTGETQGSLAHTNRGGPQNRDGYLRKLSSSGSALWTR